MHACKRKTKERQSKIGKDRDIKEQTETYTVVMSRDIWGQAGVFYQKYCDGKRRIGTNIAYLST
jgi:hypothetical protein